MELKKYNIYCMSMDLKGIKLDISSHNPRLCGTLNIKGDEKNEKYMDEIWNILQKILEINYGEES